MARDNYFPSAAEVKSGRLYIAKQNSRPAPSSAPLRPFHGAGPSPLPPFVATKAAMGAVSL